MTMSISALPAPAPSANPAAQLAGLEAQIARYKQQLSDSVNCDSAKTIAGQSAIEDLSSKINVTEERVEAIAAVKSGGDIDKPENSAPASQSEARRLAPTGALVDKFA